MEKFCFRAIAVGFVMTAVVTFMSLALSGCLAVDCMRRTIGCS